uniref:Uncharacterized protein n=1 Tax=Anguilla anguilla TaxID=7936 RepID=A0A0E9PJB8_ANGAN
MRSHYFKRPGAQTGAIVMVNGSLSCTCCLRA